MTGSSIESAGATAVVVLLTLQHCTTLLTGVCGALLGVVRSVNQLRSEWGAGKQPEPAQQFQIPPGPDASRAGACGPSAAPLARTPDQAVEEALAVPPPPN